MTRLPLSRTPGVRIGRRVAGVLLAASVAVGCSGSDEAGDAAPDESIAVASTVATTTSTVVPPETTAPEVVVDPAAVRVDVTVGQLSSELTGLLIGSDDPFADFVSCSGHRSTFGIYSVLASVESGAITSISVVSSDLVAAAGVHDAAVRLEFGGSAPAVDAVGTITVSDDLRSGSFIAFDAAGGAVEGSFDCTGGDADPRPLVVGSDNVVLEAVEVFALLRHENEQRIVDLATPANAALVECAGAEGAPADLQPGVRVVGDDSIGSITEFELRGGPEPTMRMLVGATVYASEQVTRTGTGVAAASSFSADAGGVGVDGAFRCS